ncbi:MAG: ATP-binding protein [Myxococcales bacterium]
MGSAQAREEPLSKADAFLEAQSRVLEMIVRGCPLSELLAELCLLVESQGESVRCGVLLVDDTGAHLTVGAAPNLPPAYHAAVEGIVIAPDLGTCSAAASRGEVVSTVDIETDPAWANFKHIPLEIGLMAAWSQPILSSTGTVLGTFGTYFSERRAPSEQERRLVKMLARTAALAIERQRAEELGRHNAERHRFLADLTRATEPLSEAAEVMQTASRMLAEHVGADRCAYAEVHEETTVCVTGDYARGVPSIVGRWPATSFGPACLESMLAGRPFVACDTWDAREVDPDHRSIYEALQIRAVVVVPLHKEGKLIAAMAIHQAEPRRWTSYEVEITRTVAGRCWEALERSRMTRNLCESEARYRAIVEASPEWVKLVSADGSLLQLNPAGLSMIEAPTAESVIGRSVYDFVVPEHRERFRAFNERVCAGHGGTLEFQIRGLRGTLRSLETTAVPLACADGQLAHLGMTRDVTARFEAERALLESRARLDFAARVAKVGFWYCDLPLRWVNWDDLAREQFFIAPGETTHIEDFYASLHPDDREATRSAVEASIANRTRYDATYRVIDRRTGTTKWIRAQGAATYDEDGTPIRFDGVSLDVTAQRRDRERLSTALERERGEARHIAAIAEENARLNEQLRDQDRRKDEFLATLAHELRNPLAPIRTGLGVLRLAGDTPQAERTRAMMERQLGHMVRMIDDLLDISRITLGKVKLKRERIDFRDAVHSALETALPLVESGRHQLEVMLPKTPLMMEADITRMAQIVANLVNNAAKYTPQGGTIALEARLEGSTLVVSVSDSGIGIPAEMLPRVFDMFTQVGRSIERSQGGLGIGLTLVRRLVELHGGTVAAKSDGVGLGSSFTIRLPALASAGYTSRLGEGRRKHVGRDSHLKVLVVDDNVDGAEALAMLLDLRGHETRVEHSGLSAVSACDEFAPDLVILDIGLPGIDGYEVARRIRADRTSRSQPLLVALTGWGSEEDLRQAQEAGFDRHCVKPLDTDKLADVLSAAAR